MTEGELVDALVGEKLGRECANTKIETIGQILNEVD